MDMERAALDDTSPEARQVLIEGYRRMNSAQKLRRVVELTHAVQQLAITRIRAEHPEAGEREVMLRLASLWLPAELMREAFGWDPAIEGY